MKRIAFCLLVLIAAESPAAIGPIDWMLPLWAQKQWTELSKRDGIEISTRLNPFVWRGDFDGDKRVDVVLLVKHKASKKEGIVFLWKKGGTPTVLGAGKAFENGGDDFSWIDYWSVEEAGTSQEGYYDPPVKLEADGLLVVKEASASGLIYFVGGKPKWQQQGD
jgi:hypothetical protein